MSLTGILVRYLVPLLLISVFCSQAYLITQWLQHHTGRRLKSLARHHTFGIAFGGAAIFTALIELFVLTSKGEAKAILSILHAALRRLSLMALLVFMAQRAFRIATFKHSHSIWVILVIIMLTTLTCYVPFLITLEQVFPNVYQPTPAWTTVMNLLLSVGELCNDALLLIPLWRSSQRWKRFARGGPGESDVQADGEHPSVVTGLKLIRQEMVAMYQKACMSCQTHWKACKTAIRGLQKECEDSPSGNRSGEEDGSGFRTRLSVFKHLPFRRKTSLSKPLMSVAHIPGGVLQDRCASTFPGQDSKLKGSPSQSTSTSATTTDPSAPPNVPLEAGKSTSAFKISLPDIPDHETNDEMTSGLTEMGRTLTKPRENPANQSLNMSSSSPASLRVLQLLKRYSRLAVSIQVMALLWTASRWLIRDPTSNYLVTSITYSVLVLAVTATEWVNFREAQGANKRHPPVMPPK